MDNKKRHNQLQREVERQKNLAQLEKRLLSGVTNQTELAAAFGVCRETIKRWIADIEQDWLQNERHDVQLERTFRIRQIEAIAVKALNSYERSKQDAESVTMHQEHCPQCRGRGTVGLADQKQACVHCNGTGKVTIETTKVVGQAGDPAFLKLAKECFVECARLRGVYPATARVGHLVKASQEVGGEAMELIEEYYVDAPADMIINAKAMLEELRERANGKVVRTIEADIVVDADKGPPGDGATDP
jgi:hypothetical protein